MKILQFGNIGSWIIIDFGGLSLQKSCNDIDPILHMLHVWVNRDDQSDLSLALCIIASWHVDAYMIWVWPFICKLLGAKYRSFCACCTFDLCYCWIFLFVGPPIKRRKRHRRKHFQNQEPCLMRGVYFKNMKWQAAIKVDKKQIHLGTVGSQEEAARLYDR